MNTIVTMIEQNIGKLLGINGRPTSVDGVTFRLWFVGAAADLEVLIYPDSTPFFTAAEALRLFRRRVGERSAVVLMAVPADYASYQVIVGSGLHQVGTVLSQGDLARAVIPLLEQGSGFRALNWLEDVGLLPRADEPVETETQHLVREQAQELFSSLVPGEEFTLGNSRLVWVVTKGLSAAGLIEVAGHQHGVFAPRKGKRKVYYARLRGDGTAEIVSSSGQVLNVGVPQRERGRRNPDDLQPAEPLPWCPLPGTPCAAPLGACDAPATVLAYDRERDELWPVCAQCAEYVVERGGPEYYTTCPNCGCRHGAG